MQWAIVYLLTGFMLSIPWSRQFLRYMASAKPVDTGDWGEDLEREEFRDGFRTLMNELKSYGDNFGTKVTYGIAFVGIFVAVVVFWPLILGLFGTPKI